MHSVQLSASAGSAATATDAAPLAVRAVVLVLLLAIAVVLGTVGFLGWRGRLAKDGRLGVRTTAAMTDLDTFLLCNRVAGAPTLVAGVIAAFAGTAAFGLPTVAGTVVAAVIGLVGSVAFALAGGVAGDRAAQAMLAKKPTVPARCAGCACGGCEALTRG
ncbi:MAG TPA: SdpI family protein [Pseudonocardiaceae bacterium]|nr:SdpI family protein [Pseudonocardiaceae bacterium]